MGHDISAYIRTKNNPEPDWNTDKEVAYFRIGAFNTLRQRLFYGIIPGSDVANAGVSGDGSRLQFTRSDIEQAINACKYYLEDEDSLRETILSKEHTGEETAKEFRGVLQQIFGQIQDSESFIDNSPMSEIREDVADIWEFCENILSEYDDVKKDDDSAKIEISFC